MSVTTTLVTAVLLLLVSQLCVVESGQGEPVTADPASFVGEWCSLSVCPSNGIPSIAYYDVINKDLKFVTATTVDGTEWGTAETVASVGEVGKMAQAVHLSGPEYLPAIAFLDETTTGSVKFVSATSGSGSSNVSTTTPSSLSDSIVWDGDGSAVTLDSTGSVVALSAAAGGANAVAVAFAVDGSNQVMFTASDARDPSVWTTPAVVASGLAVGYVSLTFVDGSPAMAVYDTTARDLLYIPSTAADGSAWASPVTVESLGDSGSHCSLAEIAGHPAILHRAMIKATYVRATDVAGTTWGTPVLLDGSTSNSGARGSLTVVDGKPFAAWLNVGTNTLRSAKSVTANGSQWEEPVVLAFARSTSFVSAADVDGYPGVSFYDDTARTLKFVLAEFPSPSPSPTPSSTPSHSSSASPSATPSPTASPSTTSSTSMTPSITPSITMSASITPSQGSEPSRVAGIQNPGTSSGSGTDTAPIIGGTVGGLAFVGIAAFLVYFVWQHRRATSTSGGNKKKKNNNSNNNGDDPEEVYPTNIKSVNAIPERHTVIQGNPAFGTKKPTDKVSPKNLVPAQQPQQPRETKAAAIPTGPNRDGIELSPASPRSAIAKAGASQTSALKASYGVPQAHSHLRRSPRTSPAGTTASRGRTPAGNRFPVHEEDDESGELDGMFGVRSGDVDVGFGGPSGLPSPQSPEWM